MNYILFVILCLICSLLIFEGINNRHKIYQFPFFMAAIFASFIIPQAFALIYGSYGLDKVPQSAITRVILMSCLCISMCWIGYQLPLPKSWFAKVPINFDQNKLVVFNIIYIVLGIFFWLLVFRLPDGDKLSGTSTGPYTILVFFAKLFADTGFALAIINFFTQSKKSLYFAILICASIMPFYRAVFFGRRTGLAALILIVGIAFYLFRRYVPPRSVIVLALVLVTILIPFLGQQRGILSGKWNNLETINYTENLENVIQGKSALELRNAALMIDAAANNGKYEWGTIYWNNLVFRYVPAQFLGTQFKKSLLLNKVDYREKLQYQYNYKVPMGSTPTGIGDSFTQFDYFGCLFFVFMAILFKWLWYRAISQNSLIAQVIYMVTCAAAMIAITHATADFIPNVLFSYISLLPIMWWCKKNIPVKYYDL